MPLLAHNLWPERSTHLGWHAKETTILAMPNSGVSTVKSVPNHWGIVQAKHKAIQRYILPRLITQVYYASPREYLCQKDFV